TQECISLFNPGARRHHHVTEEALCSQGDTLYVFSPDNTWSSEMGGKREKRQKPDNRSNHPKGHGKRASAATLQLRAGQQIDDALPHRDEKPDDEAQGGNHKPDTEKLPGDEENDNRKDKHPIDRTRQ